MKRVYGRRNDLIGFAKTRKGTRETTYRFGPMTRVAPL